MPLSTYLDSLLNENWQVRVLRHTVSLVVDMALTVTRPVLFAPIFFASGSNARFNTLRTRWLNFRVFWRKAFGADYENGAWSQSSNILSN